jgi:hypothetical protein
MSKDLKKVITYSCILTIILFVGSSFVSSFSGCESGTLCFNPAQKFYGFPIPYLNESLKVTNYFGMFFNILVYYVLSFTLLFFARIIKKMFQK